MRRLHFIVWLFMQASESVHIAARTWHRDPNQNPCVSAHKTSNAVVTEHHKGWTLPLAHTSSPEKISSRARATFFEVFTVMVA